MKVFGIKYYLHISMIKKYPNGIKNRNAEFDKFIESKKYKNIKTYADFIHNPEMMKQKVYLSEEDQKKVFSQYARYRKGIVWTKQIIRPLERDDDRQISQQYENKTLFSFFKESIKEKKSHNRYFLSVIFALLMHPFLYFYFYYGKQQQVQQTVRAVGAQRVQKYDIKQIKKPMERIEAKINLYLEQCKKIKSN